MNDSALPPSPPRDEDDAPAARSAPGGADSRGSDPPKGSGDAAARDAGVPAPGPSAPSEIDRSTDA